MTGSPKALYLPVLALKVGLTICTASATLQAATVEELRQFRIKNLQFINISNM